MEINKNYEDIKAKQEKIKQKMKQKIEAIELIRGYSWKFVDTTDYGYGSSGYVEQCRYLDYENGCKCLISKDNGKCSDYIEYKIIEPRFIFKILGFKAKKIFKKCCYYEDSKGKKIMGTVPPFLDAYHEKNIYKYMKKLINEL